MIQTTVRVQATLFFCNSLSTDCLALTITTTHTPSLPPAFTHSPPCIFHMDHFIHAPYPLSCAITTLFSFITHPSAWWTLIVHTPLPYSHLMLPLSLTGFLSNDSLVPYLFLTWYLTLKAVQYWFTLGSLSQVWLILYGAVTVCLTHAVCPVLYIYVASGSGTP